MEVKSLKSVNCPMSKFLANSKDYITITEWANGEGWDISIDDRLFSLHYDELAAINYLTAFLQYDG